MTTNPSLTHSPQDGQFSHTITLYPVAMKQPNSEGVYSSDGEPTIVSSVWLRCATCRLINVDGDIQPAYAFGLNAWHILEPQ